MSQPDNLESTFAVIRPGFDVATVEVTDSVFQDLDTTFDQFAKHQLVAAFRFDQDWPTWEIHPHGDEIVVMVSGDVEMILKEADGNRTVVLNRAGEFVVVPRATWHTAKVNAPTHMIFITPGEGTLNKETPED